MEVCVVCTDATAAGLLHAAGFAIVLMGRPGDDLGRLAARLRFGGGGRVAVFVGDPAHPADLAAATTMAEEQFRAGSVTVASLAEARALIASAPHGG